MARDGMNMNGVGELLQALRQAGTYHPVRNPYALLGLGYALLVPMIWILAVAAGATPGGLPLVFTLHALVFGAAFAAFGEIHRRHEHETIQVMEAARRESGSARENERLKARFMAHVTHELKTPLVAIRGYAEAIHEGRFGPLLEKQREGLGIAIRNVDRLQGSIEKLLEFERAQGKVIELGLSTFELCELVQETIRRERSRSGLKKFPIIRLDIPSEFTVRGDRIRIGIVLSQLLLNAAKYSAPGTPVGVDALREGGRARVTIWDRGPGIPPELQERLFTHFWQAERRHGGMGLGLAVCKGILEAHGSNLEIVSSEGAGTRVSFSLPAAEAEIPPQEVVHVEPEAAHPDRG